MTPLNQFSLLLIRKRELKKGCKKGDVKKKQRDRKDENRTKRV
jgi:hypothetical protein